MAGMRILVLNGGSSSFKCALHEISEEPPSAPPKPLWEKHVDLDPGRDSAEWLEPVLRSVPGPVDVVGHRIVHGGSVHLGPKPLTTDLRKAIAQQGELAPTHNKFELAAIEQVDRVYGSDAEQFAVFDTSFHATLQPSAYVYPGPYSWLKQGIRRF